MIISKKQRRLRRAVRTRAHIRDLDVARLTVHRTPKHIYAQVTDAAGTKVIAAASTTQKAVREGLRTTGNVAAAKAVGRAIAERSKAAGVNKVAFDRSGFQFHGRVKALADAAGGVAHHGERGEAELPAALNHLGGAVDRDELLDELVRRLPLLWSCHMSALPRFQDLLRGPPRRVPSPARGTGTRSDRMPPC